MGIHARNVVIPSTVEAMLNLLDNALNVIINLALQVGRRSTR
ncbi:MAG: hypothetical protein V3V00_07735 [Saprospiraceae bacterium]